MPFIMKIVPKPINTKRAAAGLVAVLAYDGISTFELGIAVELAWLHCGRALIRSRIWEPGSYPAADALPSLAAMIAEEIGDIDDHAVEAKLERANTVLLWSEPTPTPG